jgi:hypothetical protein
MPGARKLRFSGSGGVHALYTPAANLAGLAYLLLCRMSKLLILQAPLRFSEYQVRVDLLPMQMAQRSCGIMRNAEVP